jgi:hypothetical protein
VRHEGTDDLVVVIQRQSQDERFSVLGVVNRRLGSSAPVREDRSASSRAWPIQSSRSTRGTGTWALKIFAI